MPNTISSWSYDMEGHMQRKAWQRYCELANKTTQQLYKVATPCLDDLYNKDEENGSVGELPTVCPQIVSEMSACVARIGRPDILTVCEQTCSCAVTKWTKACDKPLLRLISYIYHTCEVQAIMLCGKYSTAMQVGTVSRF